MLKSRGFLMLASFLLGLWIAGDLWPQFGNWRSKAHDGAARVVREQEEAWNNGDLAGFLAGYAMDSDITFFSDDRISHGWVGLNDRYRKRYSTPDLMGKLEFDDPYFIPLSSSAVLVRGRWTTTGTPNAGTGLFTLLVRKTDAGWKVVHDHTSAKKN